MEKEPLSETKANPPSYVECTTGPPATSDAPQALYPTLACTNDPQANSVTPQVLYPNQQGQTPTVVVINSDQLGRKCPQCNQMNTMDYQDVISTRQHLWALCLCCALGALCAWIPYVSNECMHNQGKCRSCGYKTKDTTNNTGLIVAIVFLTLLFIIVIIIIVSTGVAVVQHHRIHHKADFPSLT